MNNLARLEYQSTYTRSPRVRKHATECRAKWCIQPHLRSYNMKWRIQLHFLSKKADKRSCGRIVLRYTNLKQYNFHFASCGRVCQNTKPNLDHDSVNPRKSCPTLPPSLQQFIIILPRNLQYILNNNWCHICLNRSNTNIRI